MNVHEEDFAHSIPSKKVNSLAGFDHGFADRSVVPPDQRPPALGYMPLPEPRAELSHSASQDPYHFADRRSDRPMNGRNLNLRTMTNTASMPEYNTYLERDHTGSPLQRAHSVHSTGHLPPGMYPPLRPEGPTEQTVSSPQTDRRLPSFHQLSKIADSGPETGDTRATGLPNLATYTGQIIPQTATASHHHFAPSQQSSPSTNLMMLGHPSPTNTRNDGHEAYAPSHSPASFSAPNNNFDHRRKSAQHNRPPPFIPTMTSSSMGTGSSMETVPSLQSQHSSEGPGYSTNHTTPMGSANSSLDGTTKSSGVPRLHNSTSAPSGFLCEYPGCSAPPFQTQYLLNSHANVHSSSRPHYCPVKGCPRGEGGKGFKRKNEMIRHGLVHDSPGYVCPFCPLREHRYPRPDNLQRHVRVHHVDKDKDDPLLREVLAQRPEGGGRGRRRRAGPT
ncbi:hypothetical protein AUEXF2481DRAFT_7495 [Aureobasidium subglaciale EXF-2481]|uniref:C2H2-type domain-containing protein n=1 Tax=Aureobasidium subglaciale (strain EXF-2481) TaxID=1043005 RepID=A0A074Z0X6_AURSE|nr:uncharacterized protein AUEXF2481DRAFT_7495 [Aureobasidium subglaciale EXF-2481]KEQ92761.1 hypothetical protein AUEXF2481DRAFT_7495 [Aureobasidium subglaciale EXF-2481]